MRKAWLRLAVSGVGLGLPLSSAAQDGTSGGPGTTPDRASAAERAAPPAAVPVLGPWGIVALIAAMATGPALVLGTRRPPSGGRRGARKED
jgi:hypothetical protein